MATERQLHAWLIVFLACFSCTILLWNYFFNSAEPLDRTITSNMIFLMGLLFSVSTSLWIRSLEKGKDLAERAAQESQAKQRKLEKMYRELQESEENLRRASKTALMGELAIGLANELNNPFGVILGFARSARKQGAESESLKHALHIIEHEAEQCSQIIKDLMTFSSCKEIVTKQKFSLGPLIDEAASYVLSNQNGYSIQYARELETEDMDLTANRNQCYQMLVHLMKNAVEAIQDNSFGPQEGVLRIHAKKYREKDEPWLEIRVEDTGIGIPPSIRSRIFEPFFTTKHARRRVGLGLAIVQEVVNRHRGVITVESQAGQGTSIGVALPAGDDPYAGPGA